VTFTDETERVAGRIFLDAWQRRLKDQGQLVFMLPPAGLKTLIAERRAYRLAEAVWKEGAAEC
jgi:tRNA1(Val) A37 N6-methylase TrmN6